MYIITSTYQNALESYKTNDMGEELWIEFHHLIMYLAYEEKNLVNYHLKFYCETFCLSRIKDTEKEWLIFKKIESSLLI